MIRAGKPLLWRRCEVLLVNVECLMSLRTCGEKDRTERGNLYKTYIPVITQWLGPRTQPRVQRGLCSFAPLPASLPQSAFFVLVALQPQQRYTHEERVVREPHMSELFLHWQRSTGVGKLLYERKKNDIQTNTYEHLEALSSREILCRRTVAFLA